MLFAQARRPGCGDELRPARRVREDRAQRRSAQHGEDPVGETLHVPRVELERAFAHQQHAVGALGSQNLREGRALLAQGLTLVIGNPDGGGPVDLKAQAASLTENLTITADSLYAFQRDLEARGIADRVLTLVWSEFGRRAAENGSGTDHGAAGIGFVIGTRASGRMIGEFPGLGSVEASF